MRCAYAREETNTSLPCKKKKKERNMLTLRRCYSKAVKKRGKKEKKAFVCLRLSRESISFSSQKVPRLFSSAATRKRRQTQGNEKNKMQDCAT